MYLRIYTGGKDATGVNERISNGNHYIRKESFFIIVAGYLVLLDNL